MGNMMQIKQGLLALALVGAAGSTMAQHVHGQAELEVAVSGDMLVLGLHSPLESLLGFEHAPRTAGQKAAAENLLLQMRKPETLFVPAAAAQCVVVSSIIDAPVLGAVRKDGAGQAAKAPAAAAKSGGHKEKEKQGHAELVAEFTFKCARSDQLRGLEARVFDSFKRLRRVDVKVTAPGGQSSARLTPSRRALTW
jgi:hypothetical protein